MNTKTKKQSGFTLVEMLVTLGIMMLLMGITMPFEISYRNKAEIKKSVKELRSLFWEAQNRSLAPRSVDVISYRVVLHKGQNKLSPVILQECTATSGCSIDALKEGGTPQQVTLGNNITIGDVMLDVTSKTGEEVVDFAVGGNQTSGGIRFFEKSDGMDIPITADKMKIQVISSNSTLKYDIIIDRKMGSITYGVVTP